MQVRRCAHALFVPIIAVTMVLVSEPEVRGQKRIYATADPNRDLAGGTAERFDQATGVFAPTAGSLNTPRYGHSGTLLPDGKVLIAGGYNRGYLDSAELYDPAGGTFAANPGTMNAARNGHSATLLPNGTVLFVGGSNGTFLSTAETYSPATGIFTSTAGSMTQARIYHQATLLQDETVLITGGYNGSYLKAAEIYKSSTRTFTTLEASMVAARQGHTATLLKDGKVLIAGGYNLIHLNIAEIYDPSKGTFTATTGTMIQGRSGHTATLLPDGKVLIVGGSDGNPLASAEIYDPASGNFSAVGNSLATAREAHTATWLDNGKVLVAGGYNKDPLNTAEIYNPSTAAFEPLSQTMTSARAYHSATALADGKVLIVAGERLRPLVFDINTDSSDNVSPDIVFTPDAKRVFVPFPGSGTIVALSAANGEILKRIQTGGMPTFVTPLKDGRSLAVVSALDNQIFIVDMNTAELTSTYAFKNALFGFGSLLSLSSDGAAGFISSTDTGEVIKFDVASGKELGRLQGLTAPCQITVLPDGSKILVVDTLNEEVVLVDSSTLKKTGSFSAVAADAAADFTVFSKAVLSPDGYSGIVAARSKAGSLVEGSAFVFKAATGELLYATPIGYDPGYTALTPDGLQWLILNQNSLSVIPVSDPDSFAQYATVQGGPLGSANIVFTPDSKYAFYVSSAADLVFQHELATDAVIGQVRVGDDPNVGLDQPSSLAITPDGTALAAVSFASNRIDLLTDVTLSGAVKFTSKLGAFAGLSLVNTASEPVTLTVNAMNTSGRLLQDIPGLTNPTSLTLLPNRQISATLEQLFNFNPEKEYDGWLSVESDRAGVVGYLSMGRIRSTWLDSYLDQVHGTPLFRRRLRDLIVPEVSREGDRATGLEIVNPNFNDVAYDFSRVMTTGASMQIGESVSAFARERISQNYLDTYTTPYEDSVLLVGGRTDSSTAESAETYKSDAGTFASTNNQPRTAREGHRAVLLRDGTVLLAGGRKGTTVLSSAEIYYPEASAFAHAEGVMNSKRYRHSMTLLQNGKVLVAGGQNADSTVDSAEVYDPTTQTFTATAGTMTAKREAQTATLLPQGKVLIAGGADGDRIVASAEIYDPAAGTFTAVGAMNAARAFHTATLLPNGKVLIAGGYDGASLDSLELFDPATGKFTVAAAAMTSRRSHHTATVLADGQVLFVGGQDGANVLNTAEIYDPDSGSVREIGGAMAEERKEHTATLLADGTVLVAGGADDDKDDDSTGVSATVEIYDPGTDDFVLSSVKMNTARAAHTATALLQPGTDGYLRMTSTQGLLVSEYFGTENALAALNGIDVGAFTGVRRIYSPQFAMVRGFKTILNLINANSVPAEATITLHRSDGGTIGRPVTVRLLQGAQLKDNLASIFAGIPAAWNTSGWLEVESTADLILGTITFTDDSGAFLATFELSGTPLDRFIFPMAAEDPVYLTAIALLNAGSESASATIELWGPDGTLAHSRDLTLLPGHQLAQYLGQFFPNLEPRLVANVRVRSDRPLHSFALFHDRDSRFVTAMPAQAIP